MPAPAISNYVDSTVQSLYDTGTIVPAGTAMLAFFASPLGQGATSFALAGAKTLADTNMDLAGQLPSGQNFRVLGFRAQPAFTLTGADAQNWSLGAWLVFTVGQKPYLRVPLDTVPAGMGPYGAPLAAGVAVYSHGFPSLSNAYTVGKKPLELSSTTNFGATMNWTTPQAVTTTIPHQPAAAGLPVRLYLDGFFFRAVQ